MKKLLFLSMALFLVLATSCAPKQPDVGQAQQAVQEQFMAIPVDTVDSVWFDTTNVINDTVDATAYLYYRMDIEASEFIVATPPTQNFAYFYPVTANELLQASAPESVAITGLPSTDRCTWSFGLNSYTVVRSA